MNPTAILQYLADDGNHVAQSHRRPWPIYISPRLCFTRNVIICLS